MPKLFLLFSHTLTGDQTADARQSLGVTEFVSLPEDLQARWSEVPPGLERIDDHLQPALNWLAEQAQPGDYVLVQGDFGAIYAAVSFALEHRLIPVYATTQRNVVETRLPDGKVQVQRTFQHVRYRRYELGIKNPPFLILNS